MSSIDLAPCPRCEYNVNRCDSDNLSIICPILTKWALHGKEKNQGFRITQSDFDELQALVSPPIPSPGMVKSIVERTKQGENAGLESMKAERDAQLENYGKFVTSGTWSKERAEEIRQRHKVSMQGKKRKPMPQDVKQRISSAVRATLRNNKV